MWQPIETAPKDGTRIVAFRNKKGRDYVTNEFIIHWNGVVWQASTAGNIITNITHWMPLPNPPVNDKDA